MHGTEEDSGWDSLAIDLGLEPAPAPKPAPPAPQPVEKLPEPPAPKFEPVVREEVFEVVPAHVTEIEMKVIAVDDLEEPSDFGQGVGEDVADVLDDEAPEGSEAAAAEGPGEGEGKGRRRRRRRRRKKGGAEVATTENAAVAESDDAEEATVLAFPSNDRDDEDAEEAPDEIVAESVSEFDESEDEVEEIVPDVGLAAPIEEELTEPLPEWKVTSWTELIGTLYRPQDR